MNVQVALIAIVLASGLRRLAAPVGRLRAAIARWLERPGARRAFNGAMGGLLVLSLVPVLA
jgi:threonine/homoserine/homoserine lactone efflux protein